MCEVVCSNNLLLYNVIHVNYKFNFIEFSRTWEVCKRTTTKESAKADGKIFNYIPELYFHGIFEGVY